MAKNEIQNGLQTRGKPSSKLLPMIIMGLNILAMGAGLYLSYLGAFGLKVEPITEKQAKADIYEEDLFKGNPVLYSLEPFTVNLGGEEGRMAQVKLSLEMVDEQGFEEVVSLRSLARDSIVQILGAKTPFDLQSIQGKLFLKDEIAVALNSQLKKSFVKDIYFSRFVIQ